MRQPYRILVILTLLATTSASFGAQTLIHYRLNDADTNAVAGGSVPNGGTLGAGITGGIGTVVTLSTDIPTNGVPSGAGNRSINGNGAGGIRAPGTQQLHKTNIFNNGGFTYEAWFKWNGTGTFNNIIDYAGTETLARLNTDVGPRMRTSDGAAITVIGSAASNLWHYAAAVFTPTGPVSSSNSITGNYTFYLDSNVPVKFASNVVITSFGDDLNRTIGVAMHPQGFAGNYFNGLIYEPRVTLAAVAAYDLLFRPPVLVVSNINNSGTGSLRDTVAAAPNGALITFDPALNGTTITLSSQISLLHSVTIDARSLPAGLTVSGGNATRIFYANGSQISSLLGLTLTGGNAVGSPDSGIGGAIKNEGTLTLARCTLSGNSASSFGGGAIHTIGDLTLEACTLSGNSSTNFGGAIQVSGNVTLTDCTLSGNSAAGGGAIFNGGGRLTLTHCTLALNQTTGASGGGGGIHQNGTSALTLTACILAGNTTATGFGPDLWKESGTLTATHCLIGDGTFSTITNGVNGNLVGTTISPTNALLAPLGNYGGPTQTMPPLPGSPAIDAAIATGVTTDQRGFPRPVGLAADIGAVEGAINPASPAKLTGVTKLGNGTIQFEFTNSSGTSFTVLASTNLVSPLNTWSNLGFSVEVPPGSGQFQFTDPQATNFTKRFYRVRVP